MRRQCGRRQKARLASRHSQLLGQDVTYVYHDNITPMKNLAMKYALANGRRLSYCHLIIGQYWSQLVFYEARRDNTLSILLLVIDEDDDIIECRSISPLASHDATPGARRCDCTLITTY